MLDAICFHNNVIIIIIIIIIITTTTADNEDEEDKPAPAAEPLPEGASHLSDKVRKKRRAFKPTTTTS